MCSKRVGRGELGELVMADVASTVDVRAERSGRRSLCRMLAGLAMFAAGCGTNSDAARATSAPAASTPVTAASGTLAAPAADAPVDVALVDHDGLMAAVAARRGKIVVLDCWSTSCPPCIKEFPGLVALAKKYPADVDCLSLAFDYEGIGKPEDALPPIREFLQSIGAGPVGNMLAREDADTMYRKLDLDSVPAVYVWKADGTLARRFDDDDAARRLRRPFTYADVEETVRELLPR